MGAKEQNAIMSSERDDAMPVKTLYAWDENGSLIGSIPWPHPTDGMDWRMTAMIAVYNKFGEGVRNITESVADPD
jgi:hypothetical protein